VESDCWSNLSLYIIYRFDDSAYDGANCTNVPEAGLCQLYIPLGGGAAVEAAYPSTDPWGWLLLEDNDAYALPPAYNASASGGLGFADVYNEPCTQGTEGCLPKIEVRSQQ